MFAVVLHEHRAELFHNFALTFLLRKLADFDFSDIALNG
jgi:hypothetical protein